MKGRGTIGSYVTGFVGSLILTLAAYGLVVASAFSDGPVLGRGWVTGLILVLALAQFGWQVVYFLHLKFWQGTGWHKVAFWFMGLVVGILVLGSLWIMLNLNYHSGGERPTDREIMQDEGIY